MNAQAYAYPEYDALRVVSRSEIVGITMDGWKIKHCVTVFDFGKPPVDAVDPDAQMQEESLVCHDERTATMLEGLRRAKAKRDAALFEGIRTHLKQHGPTSARKLGKALGVGDNTRTLAILRGNADTFVFHGGQFAIWGLVGQPYEPERRKLVSPLMLAIRDAIQTHGPQTSLELASRLHAHPSSVLHSVTKHPNWFYVVEVRPRQGGVPKARVWGLVTP